MYATGTASGPQAVIQALAAWCTGSGSPGFTVDNNAAYSGGWWLAVHKGSVYLNFVVDSGNSQITVYGATGFNAANAPSAQPGTSSGVGCNCGVGPYTAYHFFSTSGTAAYLHFAIEKSTNLFAHINAGGLNTVGGAPTSIYLQMTYWNYSSAYASYPDTTQVTNVYPWTSNAWNGGVVGLTVDGTFRWFTPGAASPGRIILPFQYTLLSSMAKSPNTFNGLPIFFNAQVFAERSAGNIYAYIGDAPDIRLLNIKNNNPKDEITIGADTWKVFPFISNAPANVNNGPASSGYYGIAYRKTA